MKERIFNFKVSQEQLNRIQMDVVDHSENTHIPDYTLEILGQYLCFEIWKLEDDF
jgi:hypothetical protein